MFEVEVLEHGDYRIGMGNAGSGLCIARKAHGSPHFDADQSSNFGGAIDEALANAFQHFQARFDRGLAERFKSLLRGYDCFIHVYGGTVGDLGDYFLRGRVDHIDQLIARRRNPGSIDKKLIRILHTSEHPYKASNL